MNCFHDAPSGVAFCSSPHFHVAVRSPGFHRAEKAPEPCTRGSTPDLHEIGGWSCIAPSMCVRYPAPRADHVILRPRLGLGELLDRDHFSGPLSGELLSIVFLDQGVGVERARFLDHQHASFIGELVDARAIVSSSLVTLNSRLAADPARSFRSV